MQVRVQQLSGFLGRAATSIKVCAASIKNGAIYNVEVINGNHFLIDNDGNRVYMRVKPYQAQNRCEFQIMDTSYCNEAHANLVVVGGRFDEG